MAQPTPTTMIPSQKRFDLISGCVRSAMRRLRYGFSPPIWVWINYASNPKLVGGICLTYFFHDIFKCHELSSSVLLISKKRKETIKREKLAAASSWGLHIRACSLNRRRVRVQGLYNTCCHLELLPTPRGSRRGLEDSRSPELSLHGNNPFGP